VAKWAKTFQTLNNTCGALSVGDEEQGGFMLLKSITNLLQGERNTRRFAQLPDISSYFKKKV
jgi:hypothetical protein